MTTLSSVQNISLPAESVARTVSSSWLPPVPVAVSIVAHVIAFGLLFRLDPFLLQ